MKSGKNIKLFRDLGVWLESRVEIEHRRMDVLKSYLAVAAERADWHGVEGAGSDIRDCEAAHNAYAETLAKLEELLRREFDQG